MAERLPCVSDLPSPGARIHMLGVAGAGMRPLAALLRADGWIVSGSDRDHSATSDFEGMGITIVDDLETVAAEGAELVIVSSAIPDAHPALRAARSAGVPVMKRSTALGALVNGRRLAGVAGTHGKTTVTAMLGRALEAAGRDPLVLVGGFVPEWEGNARLGGGPEAVVEADEYDRSFLQLDPTLAIVTSLEPEHLECYENEDELRSAFETFARRALTRAGLLACADDPGASDLADRIGTVTTYGFSPEADYRLQVVAAAPDGQRCRLRGPGLELSFDLGAPGAHNAQNAAAALAAAIRLGADPDSLSGCLREFRGVNRRLQLLGSRGGVMVIDDYAHHPTEVRASLSAARAAWPGARLIAVFQPHLYSRTRMMARQFGEELSAADLALVLPVYAAREEAIPDVDAELIVKGAPGHVRTADSRETEEILRQVHGDAVILFMGAGDVTKLAHRAARELEGNALGV